MAHKTACKVTLKNRDGIVITIDSMGEASKYMGRSEKYISQKKKKGEFSDNEGFWWWEIHDNEAIRGRSDKPSICIDCFNYWTCSKSTKPLKVPDGVPENGFKYYEMYGEKSLKIIKCFRSLSKASVNKKALNDRAMMLAARAKRIMEG